jgi:hypothetical protein
MLRITLHHDGSQCRLQLSGKLYGPWVGETDEQISDGTKQSRKKVLKDKDSRIRRAIK